MLAFRWRIGKKQAAHESNRVRILFSFCIGSVVTCEFCDPEFCKSEFCNQFNAFCSHCLSFVGEVHVEQQRV